MPLIFGNSLFDDAYIKFVRLSVFDNANSKVFRLFRVGNDSNISPKTLCVISMPVCSSSVFDCKTPVVNVNFRPILCESGKSEKEKSEYDGKLFHAANIAKNCDKDRYAEIKEKIRLMVGRNMPLLVIVKVESVSGETCIGVQAILN